MKMLKNFKNEMVAKVQMKYMTMVAKLKEENGADGSTEKGGWIIAALIVVGLVIIFINKFFPIFFDSVGDKLMEMFNIIKIN